jgi:hypothetical protein
MAVQRNLVRGENQAELLLLPITLEFGKGELVEWEQKAFFSR